MGRSKAGLAGNSGNCPNSWHVVCVLFMRIVRIAWNCIDLQQTRKKLLEYPTHEDSTDTPAADLKAFEEKTRT
jgi:hypothetical protein